jgi:hypothetical protein
LSRFSGYCYGRVHGYSVIRSSLKSLQVSSRRSRKEAYLIHVPQCVMCAFVRVAIPATLNWHTCMACTCSSNLSNSYYKIRVDSCSSLQTAISVRSLSPNSQTYEAHDRSKTLPTRHENAREAFIHRAQIQHHGCRCPNNPCLWPFASPLISHLQHHTKLQKLKNNQRSYSTHLRAFTKASNPRYMSSFRANKSKHAFRVDNPQDSTRSGPCLGLRLARIMRSTLYEKIGNGTRGQVQQ